MRDGKGQVARGDLSGPMFIACLTKNLQFSIIYF